MSLRSEGGGALPPGGGIPRRSRRSPSGTIPSLNLPTSLGSSPRGEHRRPWRIHRMDASRIEPRGRTQGPLHARLRLSTARDEVTNHIG